MVELLRFRSNRFDPAAEVANPINPIPGQALLAWLCAELRAWGVETSAPSPEDWGWFCYADDAGVRHQVGASGESSGAAQVEWCLQIHRQRNVWDRLRGAHRLSRDSPLVVTVAEVLRAQPDFVEVKQESEP